MGAAAVQELLDPAHLGVHLCHSLYEGHFPNENPASPLLSFFSPNFTELGVCSKVLIQVMKSPMCGLLLLIVNQALSLTLLKLILSTQKVAFLRSVSSP